MSGHFETWYSDGTGDECSQDSWPKGWYWWSCQPGCLPDGDPVGPFETHIQAYVDAHLMEDEA